VAGEEFLVDLGELDAVIADMERTERELQQLTDDVERQIRALHEVWEGLAATAQRAAQDEWDQGMREMRAALVTIRGAARTAHGNYTSAVEANRSTWESLS
jgi:WXG100 family type VII secretion target